jgi:hypothetical protein
MKWLALLALLLIGGSAQADMLISGAGKGSAGAAAGPFLTASGPGSGLINVASTNFTVTLNGASFSGTQTVTITDGGQGGTFTPSVGTCVSAGTCTVTPAAAATSFTYTYKPVVLGTITLTTTNAQTWGNPGALSYASNTTYTFSGPATGSTGTPSTNFTVTLAAGSFNGTESITVADGGQGGTFAPSTGTCASAGTCTVTPVSGSGFTFTYTTSLATAITLTPTNNVGWSNPAALTYTASAGGCSQATTVLARLDGTENTSALTTLICGMVTDGTYSMLDTLYVFATSNTSNAVKNLATSSSFNLTANGTISFTANAGYTGDGSTGYFTTGYTPSTSATNYTLNSAFYGFCDLSSRVTTHGGGMMGVEDLSTNSNYYILYNTGGNLWTLNDATFPSAANATSLGAWYVTRVASTGTVAWLNGSSWSTAGSAATSTALPNIAMYVLAYNFQNTQIRTGAPDQIAYVFWGGGITSGNVATTVSNLRTRLQTYLTAVGAPTGC